MAERERGFFHHTLVGRANETTLPGQNERAAGELGDETKTKVLLTGFVKLRKRGCRLLDPSVLVADLILQENSQFSPCWPDAPRPQAFSFMHINTLSKILKID